MKLEERTFGTPCRELRIQIINMQGIINFKSSWNILSCFSDSSDLEGEI